jgi:hypothetical protein
MINMINLTGRRKKNAMLEAKRQRNTRRVKHGLNPLKVI